MANAAESSVTGAGESKRPPLRDRLAKNSDGNIEQIARDYSVSPFEVVTQLPDEHRVLAKGEAFEQIMQVLTAWGPVLLIVHTEDLVMECEGTILPGTFGRGYFNLHGDSPIGGHIRASNCANIAFVSRQFMGRPSCSIQFFNSSGNAMFKIIVRRDENRELVSEQLAQFEALRAKFI